MEAVLAGQTQIFLYAVAIGIGLGGVYDLLRCLRILLRRKRWITALCDGVFCLTGLLTFLLFMLTRGQGQIRGYIPGGMAIGGALYFFALSHTVLALLLPVLRVVQRMLQWGWRLARLDFSQPRGS